MSAMQLDEVMVSGACGGDAEKIVSCQCHIEDAPSRCANAEQCLYYAYYQCSHRFHLSMDVSNAS
ncbi:MAG: hypothetical protein IJT05_03170 [Lachnospiraceae bacterium]|nr:hypothetical protein [Lachnospiraceae bacterium]